jgi:hypothetical protein
MKKLILIQNDYAGAGKSTVVRLFRRYLATHNVAHQFVLLSEDRRTVEPDVIHLDPGDIEDEADTLVDLVDAADITIMEMATGMGEFFKRQYEQHELHEILQTMGVETMVVLPVSNDGESFDGVTDAAETFRDNVQYLIAHSTTSAYTEDSNAWDSSYAARVMDMFEAVELRIPEATLEMQQTFRQRQVTLAKAMLDADPEATFGKDSGKWLRRAIGQIEMARQYVFGDHFRALAEPDKPTRKPRAKKSELALA